MRNIPVFTTENGVASLTLKEIPYKETAYIRIQSVSDTDAFLKECCDFCRAVGATKIFGCGLDFADSYPVYTSVYLMRRERVGFPATDIVLHSVQQETLGLWLEIYNNRMMNVPNASYMTMQDADKMLQEGNGYIAYRDHKSHHSNIDDY